MPMRPFSYADYEFNVRLKTPQIIRAHRDHLAYFLPYFRGCRNVLDLGCGTGIFLDLLQQEGITATGVDDDRYATRDAKARGHHVIEAGVLDYLRSIEDTFDGVFCSHLIEHLSFEVVLELIEGVSKRVSDGGVFVLAFPNPRAIRSHLNQFWMDPQHVRFYDSSLLEGVLKWAGFEIVHNSDEPKREENQFRWAPNELLTALADLEARDSGGQLEWLDSPLYGKPASVRQIAIRWVRQRLGISLLAGEVRRIRRLLAETIHLLEDYDMEVRLVSRKVAATNR